MTRDDLEAAIWLIAGRQMTGEKVDAIVDTCEAYASERIPRTGQVALHHAAGTDLYPVIGLLAKAMLGDEEGAPVVPGAAERTGRGGRWLHPVNTAPVAERSAAA